MPLLELGKSLADVEPHQYESWGSMSGSGLSGSIENSLSRSQRCFQIERAGETNKNQNYFSTTRNLTPGPGTYQIKHSDAQVGPYSPEFSFGNSTTQRPLSESNRLWAPSDLSTPSPNAYNIRQSSTEEYLKNLLGVSKWKMKKLKRELRTNNEILTKAQKKTIHDEVVLLEKRTKAINKELAITPPPISPIKKNYHPFVTTDKKPHQKPLKIQEAPTFYLNEEQDWDFGSRNRGLNVPDMESFGYSKQFIESKEHEEHTQPDIITGSSRPKSQCRSTDFFGPNKAFRNVVPPPGEYTPELVPSTYPYGMTGTIKSGFDDASRSGTLSTNSSWNTKHTNNGVSFTFSRSASMKTPLSSTIPNQFDNPRVVYADKGSTGKSIRSRSRGGTRQRRTSNCSDLTCDTPLPLPSPEKPRASTGQGTRSLFDARSPIARKSNK